jgi:hypothetical protein
MTLLTGELPLKHLDQLAAARFEVRIGQVRQSFGAPLSADEGLDDAPPALAENLADGSCDLQVGSVEDLLDPQRMASDLTHQLLARPCQLTRRLDLSGWNKAPSNQAMRVQVGHPGRIVDVRLAPVHTGGLHHHLRDLEALSQAASSIRSRRTVRKVRHVWRTMAPSCRRMPTTTSSVPKSSGAHAPPASPTSSGIGGTRLYLKTGNRALSLPRASSAVSTRSRTSLLQALEVDRRARRASRSSQPRAEVISISCFR